MLSDAKNRENLIDYPRESSVIFLNISFLELEAAVDFANWFDKYLANSSPSALFTEIRLTTNCGKHSEDLDHAHFLYVYCAKYYHLKMEKCCLLESIWTEQEE